MYKFSKNILTYQKVQIQSNLCTTETLSYFSIQHMANIPQIYIIQNLFKCTPWYLNVILDKILETEREREKGCNL